MESCDKKNAVAKVTWCFMIVANLAFLLALTSPSWIRYVEPSPEVSDSVPQYGLWEHCRCLEIYNLFREAEDDDYDPIAQPAWYTTSQVFAIVCLLCLAGAVTSTLVFLFVTKAPSTVMAVLILVFCIGAAVTMVITKAVFGAEFHRFEYFKVESSEEQSGESKTRILADWGLGMGVIALFFTIIAGVVSCIQLVKVCKKQ